ncbi:MAG: cytochrome c oxidase subunit II [Balneolaceae bacterium]
MNRLNDFLLPPAKSTTAAEVDALFNFINLVSIFLLLGITIAMIYFVIKYRRRSEDDVTPLIHHINWLEITWSVIPLLLVLIVFGWGYKGYTDLRTTPDDAYQVRVVANSWFWEFHYENGHVSIDELYVPAERPVELVMRSSDVIHSFYVPDFRVKHDVIPNRYTSVWFEVKEPGESVVFCTEYCGFAHSDMYATVYALEQNEFDDWLAAAGSDLDDLPPAERGQVLVDRYGCTTCHSTDGSTLQGPSFQDNFGQNRELTDGSTVVVDENFIRESILEPSAKIAAGYPDIMQSFAGSLSDEDIDGIIEYIKTLE